eukprot:CAMPEP_0181094590 /NCGR_PEP_ID=MMETSP1071-20121207/10072_1 /TAXON_ID=35127 /ORGANISM="Thalassiosira sp., Strain NH16" /LENGTH=653 /DNA_ID=CAMNT_0023176925 /DNA_START=220 /DNA_END=2182 /DNA_ORIENTATION=+
MSSMRRVPSLATVQENVHQDDHIDEEVGAVQNPSVLKHASSIVMQRVPSLTRVQSISKIPSMSSISFALSPKSRKKKNYNHRTSGDPQAGTNEEKTGSGPMKRLTPWINYEVFQWTWFIVLTTLAVVDRFAWNVWPRQTYSIGAGSAGGDRTVGYKPGPWSVVLYDALARISGRYSIICYNMLLITKLECLEQLLTSPFVRKYLLDTSNIVNANMRLHNWNGIGLCVMTILHVWSILFPCVTHGYTAVVVPGVFEWPLSERTPAKCSKLFNGASVDDVFRMVEMTIFLCVLLPISVRWFASRWHAAIQLHRLINVVYFVDIVRRHSHPHSWILNTPVFVLYIIDKCIFGYYFRRNKSPEIRRVKLGKDFMILFWKSPFGFTDTIGPDYSLLLNNSSFLEEKHAFTCFENRSGRRLINSEEDSDCDDWTVGVVIRVFRRPRVPRLSKKDATSHTQRMYEEEPDMLITGPRQGEMSEKVRLELLSFKDAPLILFGAGSAVNFIIDTLQWCSANRPVRQRVSLIYTTRDYDLFQWAMQVVSGLVPICEDRGIFFDIRMAFTGSLEEEPDEEKDPLNITTRSNREEEDSLNVTTRSTRSIASSVKSVKTQLMLKVITPGSTVFCQGSAGLKGAVHGACKKVDAQFYGGRGGAREDLV